MFERDYTFTGIHASYIKALAKEKDRDPEMDDDSKQKTKNCPNIFERYIDVYMNAAIFGLLYGRIGKKDTSTKDRARIYADAFAKERSNCVFLYRLVMLLDTTTELSSENRVNRAFRDDAQQNQQEKMVANMELFHSYVLGGIEVMYEKFSDSCYTPEDYLNKIYEIMKEFKDELDGASYQDKIQQLLK